MHKRKEKKKNTSKSSHDRLHLYNRTQMFARPPQSHQSPHSKNDKIFNSHLETINKYNRTFCRLSVVTTSAPRAAFRHTRGCLSTGLPALLLLLLKTQHEEKVRHLIHNGWFVYEPTKPAENPSTPQKCAPLHNICLVTIYLFFYFCLPQHGARSRILRFLPNPTCEIQKKRKKKK